MRFVFVLILMFAVSASKASSPLARPVLASAAPGYAMPGAAHGFDEPHETASSAMARLPRGVELVLIIDDIKAMTDARVAQLLWGMIADQPGVPRKDTIQEAWGRLAEELALTRRETMDRLVGTRLMVVMRNVEDEKSMRWAISSTISEQTDRDLVARLRPAKRSIVEGHVIRSIERGEYELTTHLHENVAPQGAGGRPVSLLLAEAGKGDIFDELLAGLAGRRVSTLAETEAPKAAARLGPADVLLAVRVDPEDAAQREDRGGAVRDWDNFIILAARVTDNAVECRVVVRDSQFHAALANVPASSDAPLAALASDAALAILECGIKAPSPTPSTPVDRLFALLGLNNDLQAKLGGRLLLVVGQPRNVDPAASDLGLSVMFGAETEDLQSVAKLGDASMQRSMELLEHPAGCAPGEANAPPPEFAGVMCDAVRVAQVRVHDDNLLSRFRLFSPTLNMAWSFSPSGVGAQPVAVVNANHPAERPMQRGWWLVNIASAPDAGAKVEPVRCNDVLQLASRTLQNPDAGAGAIGEKRNWFSMGVVRPTRCVPLLRRLPFPDRDTWESAMQKIDAIEWKLYVTPSHDIEGTLTLRPVLK